MLKNGKKMKKYFIDQLLAPILVSLATLGIIYIIGSIRSDVVIRFLGGVTQEEFISFKDKIEGKISGGVTQEEFISFKDKIEGKISIIPRVLEIKSISGGKYFKLGKNDAGETIKKDIHLKNDSVIIVTAYATARHAPKNTTSQTIAPFGNIRADISIDKKTCSKDNSSVKGVSGKVTLTSTTTCIKSLPAGKHTLNAQGIFLGNMDMAGWNIKLQYVILETPNE